MEKSSKKGSCELDFSDPPLIIKLSFAVLVNEGEGTEQEGTSEADCIRNRCHLQPDTEDGARRHDATDRAGLPLQEGDQ